MVAIVLIDRAVECVTGLSILHGFTASPPASYARNRDGDNVFAREWRRVFEFVKRDTNVALKRAANDDDDNDNDDDDENKQQQQY